MLKLEMTNIDYEISKEDYSKIKDLFCENSEGNLELISTKLYTVSEIEMILEALAGSLE